MPDISYKEKNDIKILAKCFSGVLSKLSFKNGSQLYHFTFNSLYKRSARWKYCLICGRIGLPEEFNKPNHICPTLVSHNVQVLVSTSWFKLKDFFLESGYIQVLEELGVNHKDNMRIDHCNDT
ncbi:MAG: hypothetical protein GOP50_00850 [Candidatus Heimdallarchaeota archaeon]|nr:hypothetical protein [Candidatus Heimdallarchaeota archaeon]